MQHNRNTKIITSSTIIILSFGFFKNSILNLFFIIKMRNLFISLGVCGSIVMGSYLANLSRIYKTGYNSGYADGKDKIEQKYNDISNARCFIKHYNIKNEKDIEQFLKNDIHWLRSSNCIFEGNPEKIDKFGRTMSYELKNINHWSNFHWEHFRRGVCKTCESQKKFEAKLERNIEYWS
jgi:hypothetical protein